MTVPRHPFASARAARRHINRHINAVSGRLARAEIHNFRRAAGWRGLGLELDWHGRRFNRTNATHGKRATLTLFLRHPLGAAHGLTFVVSAELPDGN
jgi:hypothetical protein